MLSDIIWLAESLALEPGEGFRGAFRDELRKLLLEPESLFEAYEADRWDDDGGALPRKEVLRG